MKVLSQGNFPVRMKATGLKSVLMSWGKFILILFLCT